MSQPPVPAAIDPYTRMRETGENPLPIRAIQIETSSICNFRCASCALSLADYDRPEKHMAPEQFARVLAAFPDVEKIELQGLGEVFLNPQAVDLIRHAAARGVQVHTFSNASVITRELATRIVAAGLHTVNFSMDGADEPTFKRLRKGGTLARYKRCFTYLHEARAAAGAALPHIGVMSVLSKENYRQVPRLIAIAEELGAETIVLTKLNGAHKPDQIPLQLGPEERAWLDALPEYAGRVHVVRAWTPWTYEERVSCYWPRHMAYVTVEGDVTACCNYFDSRELKFGNVLEKSGPEIWNDAPYRAFRKRLMNGDLPDKCKTC
jgi:radical SAM protein with 4Fe4S-binding SPASM domain